MRSARVVSVDGREVLAELDGNIEHARVAFSCVVRPIAGDLVMCGQADNGAFYILGILERAGSQDMDLTFPAGASVVARKSITLTAGEGLNCIADQTIHKSREAVVDYERCIARGTDLQASFGTLRLVGRIVNTIARQCITRAKNYIRHTADYDQVKTGQMSREVDGLYCMSSKHTVMVSKKDTKIDGERIHMG